MCLTQALEAIRFHKSRTRDEHYTDELVEEKGSMKDVINRGRERRFWTKAAAPLSFIAGKAEVDPAKAAGGARATSTRGCRVGRGRFEG